MFSKNQQILNFLHATPCTYILQDCFLKAPKETPRF